MTILAPDPAGALFARTLAKRYHALRVFESGAIPVARGKPPGAPAGTARLALPGLDGEVPKHTLGVAAGAAGRRPSAGALFARTLAKRYHALRVFKSGAIPVARGKPPGAPAGAARLALPGLDNEVLKHTLGVTAGAAGRRAHLRVPYLLVTSQNVTTRYVYSNPALYP